MHALGRPLAFLCIFAVSGTARPDSKPFDLHQHLLDLAKGLQDERQVRLATVTNKNDLEKLQKELHKKFLQLLDGLPNHKGTPPARITDTIQADDYVVEKLLYESLPGYFVPALIYKPRKITARLPAVISPCGHSAVGKAAAAYQILHINLVKRGYIVLTYDPVGQGERSQFWDSLRGKSRFNLVCGEHAVLGNPLYLLGTNLARYRIWDGIRAIDYLTSLPEVDRDRIGCVGNSGGGTLTAYIAALDPRVYTAAICCYITTLPRRMANRIQSDPDADPEQDIFGFLSEGIDHAGLLALRAPRPTLIGTASFDFFPVEGARESYTQAKKLYDVVGVPERIFQIEAAEKHGLTLPLRQGVYAFFDRWLAGRKVEGDNAEIKVETRPPRDLLVCQDGQVNAALGSRHLLTLALAEFDRKAKTPRKTLAALLRPDPEDSHFLASEVRAGTMDNRTLVICVNGNESRAWQEEKEFLAALERQNFAVVAVDPRGVGMLRPDHSVRGHDYADPLVGVEENLAYNAFLVGKSLLGMRVTDVQAAVRELAATKKWARIVVCGRRDAALTTCLAAAVEPSITHVAVEDMPLTWRVLFEPGGRPINAAAILPCVFRDFGDVGDVLAAVAPRPMLIAAGVGNSSRALPTLEIVDRPFSKSPDLLPDWMVKSKPR